METPVPDQPTLEHIMRISSGGWAAAILAAGAEHAVFTHVEKGADTVDALAKQAAISPRGAGALLDGLAGLGLLTVANGHYRNTPDAAEFLVEGKRSYFRGFARVSLGEFAEWQTLPEAMRPGAPVVAGTTDVEENPFWETLVPAIALRWTHNRRWYAFATGIAACWLVLTACALPPRSGSWRSRRARASSTGPT
jgi:hypothetical protein